MTTGLGGVDRAPLPVYSRILRMVLGITILLNFGEAQIAGVIASLILLYVDYKRAKLVIPGAPA
jgi:hypothetical protein